MARWMAPAAALMVLLCGPPAHAGPGKGPEGIWLGVLDLGALKLRLAFHVDRRPDGSLHATLDSLDQGLTGIAVDRAIITGSSVKFELAKLHASFEGKLDGDALVGTFTQGKPLPLALSRVDKIEAPRRPQQPRRPFPYREEEVSISVAAAPRDPRRAGETITLGGTLSLPAGAGPFPAVVFVTGSGPQDRDETIFDHKPFLVISDALVRRGIATLRLDDRGVGKSGGAGEQLTTLDFVEDVRSELGWLAARPEIDQRAIGILGHSEGGLIGPIVASQDHRARFVVMLAGPAMTGDRILVAQAALIARAAGVGEAKIAGERTASEQLYRRLRAARTDADADAAITAFIDADPQRRHDGDAIRKQLGSPWIRTFLAIDPVPYLEKVHVPVLALAGERDLQVPKDNLPIIERALQHGKNRDATVKLIPGVNHLFQHSATGAPSEYGAIEQTFAPEALQLVTDWIVARAAALQK
ncbi:MAG TPA: alpha/beta fold hydrolase [Kofleriaceae bacterium]